VSLCCRLEFRYAEKVVQVASTDTRFIHSGFSPREEGLASNFHLSIALSFYCEWVIRSASADILEGQPTARECLSYREIPGNAMLAGITLCIIYSNLELLIRLSQTGWYGSHEMIWRSSTLTTLGGRLQGQAV
jgi:hypothetical protein